MNRYLAFTLCLFFTLSSNSYAGRSARDKKQKEDDAQPSKSYRIYSLAGNECDKLKNNLGSLQEAQNKVFRDGKTMPLLRSEMNTVLAKLSIYEGVEKLIDNYNKAREKLVKEHAKDIVDAQKSLKLLGKTVGAYENLHFLYAHLNGGLDEQGHVKLDVHPTIPQLRDNLHNYLTKTCKIDYYQEWANPYVPIALQNPLISKDYLLEEGQSIDDPVAMEQVKKKTDQCVMIAGLAGNLKVLVEHKDKNIPELISDIKVRLQSFMNDAGKKLNQDDIKEVMNGLDGKVKAAQETLHQCYSQVSFSAYKNNSESADKCLAKNSSLIGPNGRPLNTEGVKNFQQKLDAIKTSMDGLADKKIQKDSDELDQKFLKKLNDNFAKRSTEQNNKFNSKHSFYDKAFNKNNLGIDKTLIELCKSAGSTKAKIDVDCLKRLKDKKVVEDKINKTKSQLQKIQSEMIALRDNPTYYNLELAKKYIIMDQKNYCLKGVLENDQAVCIDCLQEGNELSAFVKLSDSLNVTVDDLNQVKKGVYLPDMQLATVCESSKAVKESAKFVCQRAIAKAKQKRKDEKIRSQYHVHYNKKGKPTYEKRDSNTTIAVSAFAGALMPTLNSYLYIDGMGQKNDYLYQQAVMQKNMNYLSDQQFQWYMENYTLYGTDPYALNGGYDPYYAATFQFGNPNYTAYNGYYSY